MSLQFQLSDLKADQGIRAVSGVCNDSAKFISQINTATRQLMKRGSWYGTEILMKLCVYGCWVTFPRHVGTVLGARTCQGYAEIHNHWYSIVGGRGCCGQFAANSPLIDDGQAPVYNQVSGTTGKQIAYHVVKNDDIGKTIKIYGLFYGGQPIQEKNAVTGVWEDGITITATAAGGTPGDVGTILPAMTPAVKADGTDLIAKITHVVREATSGMTYLYEYGPDADSVNALRDLAVYEPNETNPMYRRMKIKNYTSIPGTTDAYGQSRKYIDCMVKLQFIPMVSDYDFLLIDDFDAIRYAIMAVKRDEAGEDETAEASWAKAIRELNFNDREKSPGNQVSVRVRTMGSNRIITNPT